MAQDKWQQARLIPTSGINGAEEAERRATSALLAVMGSVREFGSAVVRPLGAPAGVLQCFIEVPFQSGERTIYPDGVLQTSRAGQTWTALVEVKTGSSLLDRAQVESYLDAARDGGHDAVLTISNQLAPAPGVHPVEVDKRKLRKVALHHLSWAEVLTVAVQQRVHRGVADPDQAWILAELIRYLEHPRSGALDFDDMGAAWVEVREAIAAGTLRDTTKGLAEVVSRWEQLLRFAALRLGRELGVDAQVRLSRKEAADPSVRFANQTRTLVDSGYLTGSLRIPNVIAPIDLCVDVRAARVTVSADIDGPREGRPATRVNWLVRQLKDAPDGLRVDAFAAGSRSSTSDLLKNLREDTSSLIGDPKKELRTFRVAASSPMGAKRGTGRGGFIDSVLIAIDGFYAAVLQQLRPWAPKAPQLPSGGQYAVEESGIDLDVSPRDLQDPLDSDPVYSPEPGWVDGSLVDSAPQPDAPEPPGDRESPPPTDGDAEVLVSWDDAQDRLDHERDAETGATPIDQSDASSGYQQPAPSSGHPYADGP